MHLTAKAVITGSFGKVIFSEIYPVHSILSCFLFEF